MSAEKRWYAVRYQLLTDPPGSERTMWVEESSKIEAVARVLERWGKELPAHQRLYHCIILGVREAGHVDQKIEIPRDGG